MINILIIKIGPSEHWTHWIMCSNFFCCIKKKIERHLKCMAVASSVFLKNVQVPDTDFLHCANMDKNPYHTMSTTTVTPFYWKQTFTVCHTCLQTNRALSTCDHNFHRYATTLHSFVVAVVAPFFLFVFIRVNTIF